jgi:hypothetical protein
MMHNLSLCRWSRHRGLVTAEETFGPGLDDKTALEMSYKFPISKNFSLLPYAQMIFNPVNNPGKSSIWVVGLPTILTP